MFVQLSLALTLLHHVHEIGNLAFCGAMLACAPFGVALLVATPVEHVCA